MKYYEILDVPPDATPEQIKAAYRILVQLHHPDRLQQSTDEVQSQEGKVRVGGLKTATPHRPAVACGATGIGYLVQLSGSLAQDYLAVCSSGFSANTSSTDAMRRGMLPYFRCVKSSPSFKRIK